MKNRQEEIFLIVESVLDEASLPGSLMALGQQIAPSFRYGVARGEPFEDLHGRAFARMQAYEDRVQFYAHHSGTGVTTDPSQARRDTRGLPEVISNKRIPSYLKRAEAQRRFPEYARLQTHQDRLSRAASRSRTNPLAAALGGGIGLGARNTALFGRYLLAQGLANTMAGGASQLAGLQNTSIGINSRNPTLALLPGGGMPQANIT